MSLYNHINIFVSLGADQILPTLLIKVKGNKKPTDVKIGNKI